jgi:hypothetical protein
MIRMLLGFARTINTGFSSCWNIDTATRMFGSQIAHPKTTTRPRRHVMHFSNYSSSCFTDFKIRYSFPTNSTNPRDPCYVDSSLNVCTVIISIMIIGNFLETQDKWIDFAFAIAVIWMMNVIILMYAISTTILWKLCYQQQDQIGILL